MVVNINKVVEIVKSPEDKREYRGLILSNDMKVLLISDPTSEKASAALDINIGHLSDPDNLQGLAHFCEHMLFLGTEKYPGENSYTQYLNEHGGSSNAFTSGEHTNYYFDVRADCLAEALDRFAQFFLCPLFNADATDREVNAIESENQKNLLSDSWRVNQLDKATSAKGHPYNKFGTGNIQTLKVQPEEQGINVRDALLKYHGDLYSSNVMGLTVLGKEALDELQDMTLPLFKDVVDKKVEVKEYLEHPFGSSELQLQLSVTPVKDIRQLRVTFPMPDLHKYYDSKPDHYVSHLVGHEGHGSLLSVLKKKGWINSLCAGTSDGAKGFMFFIVNMELTEAGLDRTDDIITYIFQYIKLLEKEGAQEWIFKEIQALDAMHFRFKDKETPRMMVSSLSRSLHDLPLEDIRYGPYKMISFRADLIEMVLSHLIPSKIRVKVISKCFEGKTLFTEKWYSTPYNSEKIPADKIEGWSNISLNPELHLPQPNEFVTTDFSIKEREPESLQDIPILIKDSDLSRVWFKQDNKFLLPKSCLFFDFTSPLAFDHPRHCSMVHLFLELLIDSLIEYSYDAELAGISYNLEIQVYGMQLVIKGYDNKQIILLRKVIERLLHLEIDSERFEIIKEKFQRKLKNFEVEQPHIHALFYMSYLLEEQAWDKAELLHALEDVTVDKIRSFIPELLGQMHIESFLAGNLRKKDAVEIADLVEGLLREHAKTEPLLPLQHIRHRELQLEDKSSYLYERKNEIHNSCCIEIYYQTELQNTESNVLLELFNQLIAVACFNQLRTQEQLGYIVFCGIRRSNGAQGLRFIIQSEKDPNILDQRIEAFLGNVKKLIEDLSDEEFKNHVEALALKKLEEPKKLVQECVKHWVEISSRQYNFKRASIEAEKLRSLEKKDVLEFHQTLFVPEAPRRHKLSVYIHTNDSFESGQKEPESDENKIDAAMVPPQKIEDVVKFKSSHPLFPLVLPYNGLVLTKTAKAKL